MHTIWRRLPILSGIVVLCLLADAGALSLRLFSDFRSFRDVAYPDSATTLRVGDFVRTGVLYPDVTQPPYYPTPYGPLSYVILSVPYRLSLHTSYPVERGLRMGVLAFFLASVALTFLISRRLTGSTTAALLTVLFAVSSREVGRWPVLIRSDFLALTFALLSVWLCVGDERRWKFALAAVCAGLSLLCKQTFVAMPIAMLAWLLWRQRFSTAVLWIAGVGTTTIAGYAFFIWREPLAWQHFAALSHPIYEYRVASSIILRSLRQAKVLFFVLAAYFVWRHRQEKPLFVVIYGLTAWLVGVLTIPQVGGNINYFFEFWMAAAILAAPGLLEAERRLRRAPVALTGLLILVTIYLVAPNLRSDRATWRTTYQERQSHTRRQAEWEKFRSVLVGRRLFSLVPYFTIWSSVPEVPDPLMNSVLERTGQWSSAPIVRNLEAGVYEAIPGYWRSENPILYRGQKLLPSLYGPIERNYVRTCRFQGFDVWLPARGAPELKARLLDAGCARLAGQPQNSGDISASMGASR